ncbi:substrate-binding domain-containing protein [Streptosporangium soli]|nr:substrate-binding domain-containing protein [Streptosporangium sp. KLBMP 9127]
MSRPHSAGLLFRCAAAVAVLTVVGCSAAGPSTGPAKASGSGEPFTVGVTTLFPTGTFAEFAAALKREGPKHDMAFDVQDVGNDAGKESRIMSAFATRKVDLVVASVVSPTGSAASLRRLQSNRVPVVCYNTCLGAPQDRQLARAFVTNDNVALGVTTGEAAAAYIKDTLGGSAKIAYLTCETYDVCKQRRKGLEKGLSSVTTEVVASQEGFVVDKATPVASAILSANPDVDVIFAENEDAVIASANAIKARGLTGKTTVFGIGINPTVGQLLLAGDGTVRHTTGQDAASWAAEVIKVADALRSGASTGGFDHFTAGPTYTHDDPEPVRRYLSVAGR